jgi:hypothetical protein
MSPAITSPVAPANLRAADAITAFSFHGERDEKNLGGIVGVRALKPVNIG